MKPFKLVIALFVLASCNNSTNTTEMDDSKDSAKTQQLKEENISYSLDSVNMNGFVVYSNSTEGKRPGILVVHEWWGLNDYAKSRARQLAQMGYVAMAVDMYGKGQTADNPTDAMKLAGPFYTNLEMGRQRLDAAIVKLKSLPQTDTSDISAIGYCYGGFIVLNAAKTGADLKNVVSFHGNLSGATPDKNLLKANILVCHGEADSMVSQAEVAKFKKQMDSIDAKYTFKSYPNATHAFTNPGATEMGKKFKIDIAYNEEADKNSWEDMKAFLKH